MTSKLRICLLTIVLFLVPALLAVSPPVPDMPANYVVDLANVLDQNTEAKLNAILLELEQKTTAQVVVLTIDSLEGESLEDFSISLAHDRWKLGQKGKDNGVLILIAMKDRKYRFEVGYGLEGVLPDSMVGSFGRTYLQTYFRKGDYSIGVYLATVAVVQTIARDSGVSIGGMPRLRPASRGADERRKASPLQIIFGILFFIAAVILFIKHPWLFLLLLMGGRGGRGGWSGGGFGGGGFGGGGGGGFGGGGASGGW